MEEIKGFGEAMEIRVLWGLFSNSLACCSYEKRNCITIFRPSLF